VTAPQLENQADAANQAGMPATADALDKQADAVKDAADTKADAIRDAAKDAPATPPAPK